VSIVAVGHSVVILRFFSLKKHLFVTWTQKERKKKKKKEEFFLFPYLQSEIQHLKCWLLWTQTFNHWKESHF